MFDPYHKWLGIPPKEQPPNHYRLLGIPAFEPDVEVIETAADKNMAYIRGCATGPHVALSQKLLNEISAARICLLNPRKKKAYDDALKAKLSPPAAEPEGDDEAIPFQTTDQPGRPFSAKKKSWVAPAIAILLSAAVVGGVIVLKSDQIFPARKDLAAGDKPGATATAPNPLTTESKESKSRVETPTQTGQSSKSSPKELAADEARNPDPTTGNGDPQAPPSVETVVISGMPEPMLPREIILAPIPSAAEQDAAEMIVKQVFQSDYVKAIQPGEKQAFARKLLKKGVETEDDPIGRYVLLREARDIAAEAGAFGTALEAIDSIAKWHEIDVLEVKTEALSKAARSSRPGESFASYSLSASALLDDAIAADKYELAKRLAPLVIAVAQKGNNSEIARLATARSKEIESLQKTYEDMKRDSEVLKTSPNDPRANSSVGRFLCLTKGDWDQGIGMLALGDDETFKRLASMELESLPDNLALADGWWKVSESLEGLARSHTQSHAAEWDRKALPSLTGLTKAKVEKRLALVSAGAAGLAGIAFDNAVSGRMSSAAKGALVRSMGGTAASEAAVADGLRWLAKHQFADGSWSVNHAEHPECRRQCSQSGTFGGGCRPGATALALLAFLGSGHTHQTGDYQEEVKNGVEFLLKNSRSNSQVMDLCPNVVANEKMYAHGMGTIALCELAALTRDTRIKSAAKLAVAFIAGAQNPRTGGWRYFPYPASKDTGDTSVVAWQIMALKSAKNLKISIPDLTFKGAEAYLNAAQMQGGSQYRYELAGKTPSPSMTAAGLLCRMNLGWDRKNKSLQDGVKYLAATRPQANNMYYNYYATQVMYQWGGEEWNSWNAAMRDMLVSTQKSAADSHMHGSWDVADVHGDSAGRLYMTTLCILTLEVYYRHLPIQRREGMKVE